jgi:hypothetical protein
MRNFLAGVISSFPQEITAGPNGNLHFTLPGLDRIGVIHPMTGVTPREVRRSPHRPDRRRSAAPQPPSGGRRPPIPEEDGGRHDLPGVGLTAENGLRRFTSERTVREPFAASHSLLPCYCGDWRWLLLVQQEQETLLARRTLAIALG